MAHFNLEAMMLRSGIRSINELSVKSGVSRPTLHRWKENDVSIVNIPVAEKVCAALGCQITELIVLGERMEQG